jgi:hypothetical protein
LPGLIRARKDHQLVYEDLVQLTKWKLLRGKFRPSLLDLVKTNTETAVKNITKKAFKKMPNIASAISALTTLKGIGPATASAILVAYSPDICPYMADENMLSTPGVEATDYTSAEYLNYVQQLNTAVERLRSTDPQGEWNPHKVELAMWTHYQIKQYELNAILEKMPLVDDDQDSNDESNDLSEDHVEDSNDVPDAQAEESNDASDNQDEESNDIPESEEPIAITSTCVSAEDVEVVAKSIETSRSVSLIAPEEESNMSVPNSSDSEKSLEQRQDGSVSNGCASSEENSNLSSSNLCYTRMAPDSACEGPAMKRIKVE